MGRAPCCEKMGLKRGPWTRDEDVILINYINQNGHENWRALPKLAGLLRCGKSCRLRWMNYLRPDIKRGNFTEEEERTIIRLHEEIGNRWSVIAAKLPGRTDNEIKNVWHTHLKKRLNKIDYPKKVQSNFHTKSEPISPLHSSSPMSSSTTTTTITTMDGVSNFPEMDESFWSEVFSADDSDSNQITDKRSESCSPMSSLCHEMSSSTTASAAPELPEMDGSFWSEFFSAPDLSSDVLGANSAEIPLNVLETSYRFEYIKEEGMDFWYDLFTSAGETVPLQLPESL